MKQKKFLLFIGSLKKGGAERNAALLANWLVQGAHEVYLVLFVKDISFELHPAVNIIQIKHNRFKNPIINVVYVICQLLGLLRKIKPHRLVTMSRIGSLFAASTFYSKTIVRFDIYPLLGYRKYKQWQFWFFYNLPWVKYVVCPSQELKDDVARFFMNKEKLVTIYNPLPQASEECVSYVHKRGYFVIVSRLHSQKNVSEVINTFYTKKLYEQCDLIVLGDGPEKSKIEAQITALKISDSVLLKGFVTNPYPYIKGSMALINASIREGFPNVLVEALTLGTPVISSAAKTGPKEIVFDGVNGFLFPVHDYEKLGSLMRQMINTEVNAHLRANTKLGLNRFEPNEVLRSWANILGV